MPSIKVGIKNKSGRSFVVATPSGTQTIRGNSTLKSVEILPLTEEQVEDYKKKGVTFTGSTGAKTKDGVDVEALEDDVEEAKAKYAEALAASQLQGAGEPQKKALKEAADKLTAAEQKLAAVNL